MARQLTFSGNGKLKTWLAQPGLQDAMATELRSLGYDVTSLTLNNVPEFSVAGLVSAVAFVGVTWNYVIGIQCNTTDDENPERVRQIFADYFGRWFDNVVLSLSYDSAAGALGNIGSFFGSVAKNGGDGKGGVNSMVYVFGAILLIGAVVVSRGSSGRR